ncbi:MULTISPECIES: DEAD/DEAH box helicase [unclassified Bradyrhizobium]|uniref:DEAD/DEAH box helicase n=1 Tax=unclassified Bradyrhizobium TaxID=2631580 RepID=UPI0028E4DBE2|nr:MULTISPECIES: DEAD/DEAH box helicase [unclassified Bradyrhizobium]
MGSLVPIEGAWVCRRSKPHEIGVVCNSILNGRDASIEVDFGPNGKAILREGEWGCGLQIGHRVQDIPLSGVRETLGLGTVLHTRELAGRSQVLVQLHSSGLSLWLPFERLRRIMDPALLYRRADHTPSGSAERLFLTVIAHALSKWNEATGALDRLDVDPLPHQISLVHRILNSGQTNWLIADDVGLGKTIEVGLLLAALERRRNLRRILFVVPSGLTRQWKDEMFSKFDRRFLIYGSDFRVSDYREWGLFEKVIVSLDLAKPRNSDDDGSNDTTPFGMFLAAGNWDLIVFDEAHRLARDDRGRSTLRFKLAQALRNQTDDLLLLTGTPHQGDPGKFRNLLALVRPDLKRALEFIETDPDVIREIVIRNRKIDAVDLDGKFLFKGLLVRRIEVEHDPGFSSLEQHLREYLRRGYGAGDALGGPEGRAIGFVMTIYRKMASSSVAALYLALKNRLGRLNSSSPETTQLSSEPSDDEFEGDDQLEEKASARTTPFFQNEAEVLRQLMDEAADVMRTDKKGGTLASLIQDLVMQQHKKVLIFTEYRSTQAHLLYQVQSVTGARPQIINGSQTVEEKKEAIKAFEADNPVLISTEAGGEGLNLHRGCHIVINYDLPWNPARISQRIGRLYRYGQTEQVVVINLLARDTIDNEIVSNLLERLETIVREMAGVGPEFNERYAAEVMGELLERVDISAILDEARAGTVSRSQERIEAALAEARRAKLLQDDILNFASASDVNDLATIGQYTTIDVANFVKRSAKFLGIAIEESRDPERFTMRLPAEMKGQFTEFGGRTVVTATTKRSDWRQGDEILLDFSTSFLNWLTKNVTAPQFGGTYASIANTELSAQFFAAFLARFQNDQGQVQSEKLLLMSQGRDCAINLDPTIVRLLLSTIGKDGEPRSTGPELRKQQLDAARDRAELLMMDELSRFKHPNDLVLLAAAEVSSNEFGFQGYRERAGPTG